MMRSYGKALVVMYGYEVQVRDGKARYDKIVEMHWFTLGWRFEFKDIPKGSLIRR